MSIRRFIRELAVSYLIFVCVAGAGALLTIPLLNTIPVTRGYDVLFGIAMLLIATFLAGVLLVVYHQYSAPRPRNETFEELEQRIRTLR